MYKSKEKEGNSVNSVFVFHFFTVVGCFLVLVAMVCFCRTLLVSKWCIFDGLMV